jgi:hypothetical protein
MTRNIAADLMVVGRASARTDAALETPYTAAIRAAAALFAEGAIPREWPQNRPARPGVPAAPLEPAGGMEVEGIETGARVFAA